MKIKTIVSVILCFSFFLSSCKKEEVKTELNEMSVAVEIDSLSYEAAKTIENEVKEIRTFSTEDGAVTAVETKNADLLVLDEFSYSLYKADERKINNVKVLPFTTEHCIYFHNNAELLQKFNVEILELQENGTISKIKDAYKTSDGYYPKLKQLSPEAPTIIMATDIAGAPYTDLTENGYVVGIDVDIANIITNSLGYNLEVVVTSADEMFNMLSEDKVDFIMSGLMYEEKRESEFDTSFSYSTTEYYLIERD
ncbi:MAG: transporter substrate-binding domain-containing protein [Ruminococcaceae bacterium]|nr:transporter substrate-binding domain-containing protein [Oscillospiraceae bacterium]